MLQYLKKLIQFVHHLQIDKLFTVHLSGGHQHHSLGVACAMNTKPTWCLTLDTQVCT